MFDDSRTIALSTFDLGVAAAILYLKHRADPVDPADRNERMRDEYYFWADSYPEILTRVEDATTALGIPRWYAEATAGDSNGRTLIPDFGQKASGFFVLGRQVWHVGLSPRSRGYLEELEESLSQLRLPGNIRDLVSDWVSKTKKMKVSEAEQVRTFVEEFRAALLDHLDTPQHQIFISYSEKDIDLAKEMATYLEDMGCHSYVAQRDIPSGEIWADSIRDALIAADELLIIVTPNSINSRWIMIESGIAWSMEKMLNVAYCWVDLKDLPEIFTKHQAVNIETAAGRQRLIQEIMKRLNRSD